MRRLLLAYFVVAGGLSALDVLTTYWFLQKGHSEANPLAPIHDVFLLSLFQGLLTAMGVLLLRFGLKHIQRNDRKDAGTSFGRFWKTITTVDNGSLSLLALILAAYWVWLKVFCVGANLILILCDVGIYNALVAPFGFLGEAQQYWVLMAVMGLAFVAFSFALAYRRWKKHETILDVEHLVARFSPSQGAKCG